MEWKVSFLASRESSESILKHFSLPGQAWQRLIFRRNNERKEKQAQLERYGCKAWPPKYLENRKTTE